MSISAIAMAGMARANQRIEASAERVAQSGEAGSNIDTGAELAEQAQARVAFSAGVAVLRASDKMLGQLLDLKT